MSHFTYLKKHLQASTSHSPQPASLQTPAPTPEEDFTTFLKKIFANMPKDSFFVIGQEIKEIAREPRNATSGRVLILLARNLVKGEKNVKIDNEVRYKLELLSTPEQALKWLAGSNVVEKKRTIGGIEWHLMLRDLGEGEAIGDSTRA
jgi:hypothetical protein